MKTILITGASSGIGKACALALAGKGVHLILTGRREAELKKVAAKCKGAKTTILVFDIRDQKATIRALKPIDADILINNAGLALDLSSADQTDLTDWNTMVDTNITGMLTATRTILPGMKKRMRPGFRALIGSARTPDAVGRWRCPRRIFHT